MNKPKQWRFDKKAGDLARFAGSGSKQLSGQSSDLKDATSDTVEKVPTNKPDPFQDAIAEYNGAFTSMNDKGISLLLLLECSTDLIELVEQLLNSVVDTPKSFETDIAKIEFHKARCT